ncbi:hypothetical protein [Leptospira noguchii]|uniref:hypothetical protein n=1 Tax=Leptospira noguchii TaxID=28182 RepID=UPI00055C9376|nr:hypothetical protein [Leptospira noguchii]
MSYFEDIIKTATPARVRVDKNGSRYRGEIGYILSSTANGKFRVVVETEGNPIIILEISQVEPC